MLRLVSSPESLPQDTVSQVSKPALLVMIVIVVALALVAIFANVQRLRREKIETVIVTPVASPSPSSP